MHDVGLGPLGLRHSPVCVCAWKGVQRLLWHVPDAHQAGWWGTKVPSLVGGDDDDASVLCTCDVTG